jgi:hypothetical protein
VYVFAVTARSRWPTCSAIRAHGMLRPLAWLLNGWARAHDVEPWAQTGWDRGKSDTATWAQERPISFGLLLAPVVGGLAVIATLLAGDLPVLLQVVIGAAGAVVRLALMPRTSAPRSSRVIA